MASIATCPLDVIKTKLQAQRAVQGQQAYLGVLGMFLSSSVPSQHSISPRYDQVCFQREWFAWFLSRIGTYDAGISTHLGYLFCCV